MWDAALCLAIPNLREILNLNSDLGKEVEEMEFQVLVYLLHLAVLGCHLVNNPYCFVTCHKSRKRQAYIQILLLILNSCPLSDRTFCFNTVKQLYILCIYSVQWVAMIL